MNKIHYRNRLLRVNAGMDFPECHAYADLLDIEKSRLLTSGDVARVTCKHCLKLMEAEARSEGRLQAFRQKRGEA